MKNVQQRNNKIQIRVEKGYVYPFIEIERIKYKKVSEAFVTRNEKGKAKGKEKSEAEMPKFSVEVTPYTQEGSNVIGLASRSADIGSVKRSEIDISETFHGFSEKMIRRNLLRHLERNLMLIIITK